MSIREWMNRESTSEGSVMYEKGCPEIDCNLHYFLILVEFVQADSVRSLSIIENVYSSNFLS